MPGNPNAEGDVDLRDDISFQEMTWRVQRLSWLALTGLLAATSLGLSGTKTVGERGVDLTFNSIIRQRATEIVVDTSEDALVVRDDLRLAWEIQRISPRPLSERITAKGVRYDFGARGQKRIVIIFKPKRCGVITGTIGAGDVNLTFSQVVLP